MSYTGRLLHSGRLLRFAHGSRYERTLDVIADEHCERALDFGGADGHFLELAHARGLFDSGVLVDHARVSLDLARERFKATPALRAVHPENAAQEGLRGSFDLVFCLEVLEHVSSPEETLLQVLGYCRPGARLVVSGPIEVGPALILKQIGRRVAALRHDQYSAESYTPWELFSAAILWDVKRFPSTHSTAGASGRDHKGYDYREIEQLLGRHVEIQRRTCSPFPPFGPLLNTTVIWKCRR